MSVVVCWADVKVSADCQLHALQHPRNTRGIALNGGNRVQPV